MPINPDIVLGIKPVQFDDPFSPQNVRNRIALQDQMSLSRERDSLARERDTENSLKTQKAARDAAAADRDLAAQRTEGDLMAQNTTTGQDGSVSVNHDAVRQGLAQRGFGKEAASYLTRVQIPAQNELIKQKKDQLDTADKAVQAIGSHLGALASTPDEQLFTAHDAAVQNLQDEGFVKPGQLPTSQQFLQQAGGDPVKALALMKQSHVQAQATTLKSEQQLTSGRADLESQDKHNKALQDLNEGKIKDHGAQLTAGAQIFGIAKTPEQWAQARNDAAVAGLPMSVIKEFGDFGPDAPARAQQLGMTPEQRQAAQQAADTLTEQKKRDDEAARHDKVDEGFAASKEKRERQIYEQTYGEGANTALVGVDPKLRVPATKEAQKAADEYQNANKTADVMQSLIDAARNGNKAAGSNLPLVGVETLNAINGIKRINRTEVDEYKGAGDLLDSIKGKVGKLATGQPIPNDVLDDIEKMHNILRQNSVKAYNDRLSGINQNYKANFQPVKGAEVKPTAASGPVVKKYNPATGKLE